MGEGVAVGLFALDRNYLGVNKMEKGEKRGFFDDDMQQMLMRTFVFV